MELQFALKFIANYSGWLQGGPVPQGGYPPFREGAA